MRVHCDIGVRVSNDIRAALRRQFFSPESAAKTVAGLKKAADGKPVPRSSATPDQVPGPRRFAASDEQLPDDNGSAVFWSVVCGDTAAWPRDPDQYRRDAIRDKARYPLYGDFGSNITPCAFWNKAGRAGHGRAQQRRPAHRPEPVGLPDASDQRSGHASRPEGVAHGVRRRR